MRTLKAPTNPIALWAAILTVGLAVGLGIQFVSAWTAAPPSPPSGNVLGPITTSATAQTKSGDLTVKNLTLTGTQLKMAGSNTHYYGDSTNLAARAAGGFYVQNQTASAYGNAYTNDVWLNGAGKWASAVGNVSGASGIGLAGQELVVAHTYKDLGAHQFCALGMVQAQANAWMGCEVYKSSATNWTLRVSTFVAGGTGAYCYANCVN